MKLKLWLKHLEIEIQIKKLFLVLTQLSCINAHLKISKSSSIFDLKHLGVEINWLDVVF